ncbi:hypothetical protein lerEdw1_019334 [Lerista edwardsae]|nr:hypothetical protein lerEdw1_019334 [Lerista edwardsae]
MDYAKKSLGFFSPQSLSRCVSAGASSVTQQLWGPPAPRPYRVTNWNRTQRKGIAAESLKKLLQLVRSAFLIVGPFTLVVDEDGTVVEVEEFFRTLPEGTNAGYQLALSQKPRHRYDVACLTLDLYKTNPEDFIGCLNFKATLYGTYSISYDMRCYGARKMLKEALRWGLLTMQATGHVLLGTSGYVQQLLDATEEAEKEGKDSQLVLRNHRPLPWKMMQ